MVTREGLRRGALVGLRSALWDGNFVDLMQRLSGGAVEHEHVAALGRQQNCRHLATGGGELDQRRLRTEVVVPHTSLCTVWKTQRGLPVFTSSATSAELYFFSSSERSDV